MLVGTREWSILLLRVGYAPSFNLGTKSRVKVHSILNCSVRAGSVEQFSKSGGRKLPKLNGFRVSLRTSETTLKAVLYAVAV